MMIAAVRRRGGGFTLLEVLVAITILSMSLVVIINIVTRNVRATNHARLVTTATFLARSKIVDVEDQVLDLGFVDDDATEEGDFAEEGFPGFRWKTVIEKPKLPTDMAQMAQGAAQDQTTSTNPLTQMSGMLGGFMSMLIEPIRIGLEESIRRLTVQVTWDEIGGGDKSIEVVTFMTDPAKLDMAMGINSAAGAAGAGGTQGAGGAGGSASTIPPAGKPQVPR